VRLLLDTHVLIWWLEESERLAARAGAAIDAPNNTVFISAVTAIEIAHKTAIGKLQVPPDLEVQIPANQFIELPVTVAHSLDTLKLPLHHCDPFDRLLVAQARCEGLTLVTADKRLAAYEVPIMPAA
jgi:PIN domain nuclease of toxin-antitoxin system